MSSDPKDKAYSIYVGSAYDDLPLTAIEFRVLARIARRGECTESAASMGNTFQVSDRTIRRATQFLALVGLVVEVKRSGQETVRKLAASENWKPSSRFEAIRKSITESKKAGEPLTPEPVVEPLTPQPPLTPETPTPDTTAAHEGTPLRYSHEGTPLRLEEARLGGAPESSESGSRPEHRNGAQRVESADEIGKSHHRPEICREYARHLRDYGGRDDIRTANGFGRHLFRTGEEDAEIDDWLKNGKKLPERGPHGGSENNGRSRGAAAKPGKYEHLSK